jgi:CubicO group peptidase (beta-lactamase class C family)
MRKFAKWAGRIALALVLAAVAVGLWKREEITRLLAVNTLFDEDRIVQNFSSMQDLFHRTPVPRGFGEVSPLPQGAPITLPQGAETWLTERSATSLIVLKGGEIRFENYYLGTSEHDLRISWSMAKSYLSALFGVLLEEGAIASLEDPVTKYAPSLKGTAYDGASIRNVLQMSSGVVFNEDYFDYNSDINRMGRVLALGGSMDAFTQKLTERFAKPGETWQYTSIDTHVLGMVIRGATGRPVAELLSEKIIAPLGQEQSAVYLTDGYEVAFVLGGLNLTARDYARFGVMFAQGGIWQGQQIVPADWVAESTTASAPTQEGQEGYGYQWWVAEDASPGEFFARGVYGQYIYIDQTADVVIVMTAADRKFREEGVHDSNIAMFRMIAHGLE